MADGAQYCDYTLQATFSSMLSDWCTCPICCTFPFGILSLSSKEAHSRDGMQEDEQAKAEEELDPAVQERRRLEQAEKWRLQQLKAGASSEENANFQVYIMLLTSLITPLWACVKLHYKSAHMHAGMSCSVTGEPCKAF